jgi:glutathione S-transferase
MGNVLIIVVSHLNLADILLFCFLDFNAVQVKQPLTTGLDRLTHWFDRKNDRAAAVATRSYWIGSF